MKKFKCIYIVGILFLLGCSNNHINPTGNEGNSEISFIELEKGFLNPPAKTGTVTLWWLNGKLTKNEIHEQMLAMRDKSGFSGVAPLTLHKMKPATDPEYLSEEYFMMYGHILETAKELGMTVVFYDDCDFPSGTAGNRMKELFPEDLAKYLHRNDTTFKGPSTAIVSVPKGKLMSVVATNLDTKQSSVITKSVQVDNNSTTLRWEVPEGKWRVQSFVCATDPGRRFVDYLNPKSMERFIDLTYNQFANRYPEHFGTTVKMTFFDDIGYSVVENYQMWTESYNEKFIEIYGYSPELLYPALWEDIGAETASARARLFSFRDQLFANGYPKAIQDWCDTKNMIGSGHPNGAYRPNPIQCPGDAILFYKHLDYPLTDYIHYYHHGVNGFKIPVSAAYNYDKPVVVLEIYGNFQQKTQKLPNDGEMLYRAGMEAYARGINYLLPHGTWWDETNVAMPPEISWRNPEMADALPAYNKWAGRCETLLRAGRHVADIGVLYPINDLQARYNFSDYKHSQNGRIVPEGSDYYDLITLLTRQIRKDYTLIHPEVLDEKCTVESNELLLNNEVNWERYKVFVLPSCKTISLSNLKNIKLFHDNGGVVIATSCLPEKSVEPGHNLEIQGIVRQMFSEEGKGIFIPNLSADSFKQSLGNLDISWDIEIDNVHEIVNKSQLGQKDLETESIDFAFNYIHKVKACTDLYFFSNSTAKSVTADVSIASDKTPKLWNPHNGHIKAVEYNRNDKTVVMKLKLEPIQSRFIVFKD
jgi:hypothetical protein